MERCAGTIDRYRGGICKLVQQGQHEAATAGAEVDDAQGCRPVADVVQNRLDQCFAIGAGNQCRRRHAQRQAPEFAPAGDVGNRLAPQPAVEQRLDPLPARVRQRPFRMPDQIAHAQAERMADQHAGIETGVGDVGVAQAEACRRERLADGGSRPHSCCASRLAWSDAVSASITSSSSPSSTRSSLCRVRPTRWSVMRPCGKL